MWPKSNKDVRRPQAVALSRTAPEGKARRVAVVQAERNGYSMA